MGDAFSLYGDQRAASPSWDFGCESRILYPLASPVTLDELRGNARLSNWGLLRKNFIGKAHAVREDEWADLWEALRSKEGPDFDKWSIPEPVALPPEHRNERDIEDRLVSEWPRLTRIFPSLRFEQRQVLCRGFGRLDILAVDESADEWVVIEIKAVRADKNVADQLVDYMTWVKENMPCRRSVRGIVVSEGHDPRLKSKLDFIGKAIVLDLAELGFSPSI